MVDGIAEAAAAGARTDLAIVVPPGCSWPLPAYELALLAHEHVGRRAPGNEGDITIVTAEDAPLAAFGPEAVVFMGHALDDAGVAVRPNAVTRAWRDGVLELAGDEPIAVERVISLPVLRGPALDGLPHDPHGFARSAPGGAVEGAPDVWAVGDAGSFPVKQGGIACEQADVAAAAIARALGEHVEPMEFAPVLRGWVWDAEGGAFLRADLRGGRDESPGVADRDPLRRPVSKVAGRSSPPSCAISPAGPPSLTSRPRGRRRQRSRSRSPVRPAPDASGAAPSTPSPATIGDVRARGGPEPEARRAERPHRRGASPG